MKRLWVRLGIIACLLSVGGYGIWQTRFWQTEAVAQGASGPQTEDSGPDQVENDAQTPPQPIESNEVAQPTPQPSPPQPTSSQSTPTDFSDASFASRFSQPSPAPAVSDDQVRPASATLVDETHDTQSGFRPPNGLREAVQGSLADSGTPSSGTSDEVPDPVSSGAFNPGGSFNPGGTASDAGQANGSATPPPPTTAQLTDTPQPAPVQTDTATTPPSYLSDSSTATQAGTPGAAASPANSYAGSGDRASPAEPSTTPGNASSNSRFQLGEGTNQGALGQAINTHSEPAPMPNEVATDNAPSTTLRAIQTQGGAAGPAEVTQAPASSYATAARALDDRGSQSASRLADRTREAAREAASDAIGGRDLSELQVQTQASNPPAALPNARNPVSSATSSPSGTANLSTDPPSAATPTPIEVSAVPGPRTLEGLRQPALQVEKIAPPEIQVGREATFSVRIRNVGNVTAQGVSLVDRVPQGTQLINATPQFSEAEDGSLVWQLGAMEPGEEAIVSMQLMPMQEGEIGSVAQVILQTHSSARTICTRPLIKLEQTAPRRVLIGESLPVSIVISNTGSGAAVGLTLEEDVPEGLAHPAGKLLEKPVGTIAPNETRPFNLMLQAVKPGVVRNRLIIRDDRDEVLDEHTIEVEVIAPQLVVGVGGPKRRYLNRQATYNIQVANPGTAAAENVDLVAYLPKGMKFVEADNEGRYDPQRHAVYWNLVELPANQQGEVTLSMIPIEPGQQKIRVEGRGELDLAHSYEHDISVEQLAELVFSIADTADPIEQGSVTTYEVRIVNAGSKSDTNIQMGAVFPEGLQPLDMSGPTQGRINGQQVVFESLPALEPGREAIYRIQAKGLAQGDHLITVQVRSDESPKPVSKEEITRVYLDR